MKLIDGMKLSGRPAEIPDCSRDDLPELFNQLGFKSGAEIGVFEGDFTEVLAKGGFEIYGIDPWLAYEDYGTPEYQPQADGRYNKAIAKLSKYPNVKILREMSMDALKHFEDESLDFVYIDGNHLFRYIADDLFEWWKKVRNGGIVAGHDYAYFKSRSPFGGCQVREIIDAYALSFRTDFWVLGTKRKREGEHRDDYRSWMFLRGDQREAK